MKRSLLRTSQGFTLIELLVVISIILIASSIMFIGGSGGDGAALGASQRIMSGVAQGARGQAILKNAETLLIIHNDRNDLEKYRRFVGIIFLQSDDLSTSVDEEGWVAATQGNYLPDGIYFDPALSKDFGTKRTGPGAGTKATLDFPRTSPQKTIGITTGSAPAADSFLFYKFNSNGTSANPNEWLALRAGNLNADGDLVDYDSNGEKSGLKAALIFRRAGTTTPVEDPSAIN